MPRSWRDEVREIVKREGFDASLRAGRRGGARTPRSRPSFNPLDWLTTLGEWVRRRFTTTSDMLLTAAGLVVLALLLTIFLRQIASVIAIAGAVLFAIALVRGIIERRAGRRGYQASGPVMWRGQVIRLEERRSPSLADRLRTWWRRRR